MLLFQDLAAIPLIALVPLFAAGGSEQPAMDLRAGVLAIFTIIGVIVVGRFLLNRLYRIVAATGVREAMTASALLTVVGVALVMEAAGLSAALGSFIAGALLADSEYRHQIEADIAPFEGLLLAVFFIAIGMSIDLSVVAAEPLKLIAIVVGLVAIKAAILYVLGRWWGLKSEPARRLGLVISQGGEFAFVLFAAGVGARVLDQHLANLLDVGRDIVDGGDAAPAAHRRDDLPRARAGEARIRDAAGRRSARHRRRLRPVRTNRRPRACAPAAFPSPRSTPTSSRWIS